MNGCPRCDIELTHCHGTLVRHDDGSRECSSAGCTGDPARHDIVLVCADVWAGCCAEAVQAEAVPVVARAG